MLQPSRIETFSYILWQFQRAFIRDDGNGISCPIHKCPTVAANCQVSLYTIMQLWSEIVFQVIGDLAPNLPAGDFNLSDFLQWTARPSGLHL